MAMNDHMGVEPNRLSRDFIKHNELTDDRKPTLRAEPAEG